MNLVFQIVNHIIFSNFNALYVLSKKKTLCLRVNTFDNCETCKEFKLIYSRNVRLEICFYLPPRPWSSHVSPIRIVFR
jgi:hypothetical protein